MLQQFDESVEGDGKQRSGMGDTEIGQQMGRTYINNSECCGSPVCTSHAIASTSKRSLQLQATNVHVGTTTLGN